LTLDINNGILFALDPKSGLMTHVGLNLGPVEHFTTPSVDGGMLLFAADQTIYALNPSP